MIKFFLGIESNLEFINMDMEEFSLLKKIDSKISITNIYKAKINSVWKIIKDLNFSIPLVSGYRSDFELVKGDNSYTRGNEFRFKWKQSICLLGKV